MVLSSRSFTVFGKSEASALPAHSASPTAEAVLIDYDLEETCTPMALLNQACYHTLLLAALCCALLRSAALCCSFKNFYQVTLMAGVAK